MSQIDAELARKLAMAQDLKQSIHMCRICLITTEKNLKNFARANLNGITYFTMYFETIGKKLLTPLGVYPPRICSTCEIELLETYKFHKKCLATEEKMSKFLGAEKSLEVEKTAPECQFIIETTTQSPIKTERRSTDVPAVVSGSSGGAKKDLKKSASAAESPDKVGKVEKTEGEAEKERRKKYRCKVCRVIFEEFDQFKYHKCMCCEPKIIKEMRAINTTPPTATQIENLEKVVNLVKPNVMAKKKELPEKKDEYTCERCGKVCISRQGFLLHMDKHNQTSRYDCDQCGQKFHHWLSRRTHIYRDHLKKPFCSCPHCGKNFYQMQQMKLHIKEMHSTDHKGYQCEKCGKNFMTKANFYVHMQNHKASVDCHICGKTMKTKRTLAIHLEMHSGTRNYVCPVCDKRYTCNFTMKKHVNSQHPDQVHLLPPKGRIVNQGFLKKKELHSDKTTEQSTTQRNPLAIEIDD